MYVHVDCELIHTYFSPLECRRPESANADAWSARLTRYVDRLVGVYVVNWVGLDNKQRRICNKMTRNDNSEFSLVGAR